MLLPGKCRCENMLLGAGDDTDQTQTAGLRALGENETTSQGHPRCHRGQAM